MLTTKISNISTFCCFYLNQKWQVTNIIFVWPVSYFKKLNLLLL